MGCCCSSGGPFFDAGGAPPMTAVPEGCTRICVAGYRVSHYTGRTHKLVSLIVKKHGPELQSWFRWAHPGDNWEWLGKTFKDDTFPDHLKGHSTSPFVWLETANNNTEDIASNKNNKREFIGGFAEFSKWALAKFPNDKDIVELCTAEIKVVDATCHRGCACCALDDPMYEPTYDKTPFSGDHAAAGGKGYGAAGSNNGNQK